MKEKKEEKVNVSIKRKKWILIIIIAILHWNILFLYLIQRYDIILIPSPDDYYRNDNSIEKEISYNTIEKITEDLYEVYFNEYTNNYDSVRNYINEKYQGIDAGCTAVYKNGLFMRNLDWYINQNDLNTGELVVHTTANEGRYATVGLSYNPLVTKDTYNTLTEEEMKIVPFILTDGMNSEGLTFAQNVVPEIDGVSDTFGTNENGEKISLYMLGRQLLDYCANVDEAIEYIKNHNIFMVDEGNGYRMESHIMIADRERAVVIEFVSNKVVVLEQEDLPYEETFMTNHYLYNGGENTGHGMGFERDEIVKSNYSSVVDWKSGMNLLEKVKYSNSYTLPMDDNFWYSEYYVKFDFEGTTYDFNKDTKNDDPTFLAYINSLKLKYEKLDGDCWWSNHSSVYDTNVGTLHLAVHENYDNIYTFNIN